MRIFVDTANLEEIKKAAKLGICDGVTTNPSLIAKEGHDIKEVISEICSLIDGDISAEVISTEAGSMVEEGIQLAALHPNVVVKVPMTDQGLIAVKKLATHNIRCNVTLVFSANQALLAAKAGAYLVSPFIGRLDDTGHDGMELIEDIRTIFDNYGIETQILAASIRHPLHVHQCALVGADVATIPFKVLEKMYLHPLTDKGLQKFLEDYQKSQK